MAFSTFLPPNKQIMPAKTKTRRLDNVGNILPHSCGDGTYVLDYMDLKVCGCSECNKTLRISNIRLFRNSLKRDMKTNKKKAEGKLMKECSRQLAKEGRVDECIKIKEMQSKGIPYNKIICKYTRF